MIAFPLNHDINQIIHFVIIVEFWRKLVFGDVLILVVFDKVCCVDRFYLFQRWDWEIVKKEEAIAGVWGPQKAPGAMPPQN